MSLFLLLLSLVHLLKVQACVYRLGYSGDTGPGLLLSGAVPCVCGWPCGAVCVDACVCVGLPVPTVAAEVVAVAVVEDAEVGVGEGVGVVSDGG